MPPIAKHPRRWYQFSLPSMFIVVTAAIATFGIEMRRVQNRRALRRQIQNNGGIVNTLAHWHFPTPWESPVAIVGSGRIPFWRRWLGDEGLVRVVLPEGAAETAHRDAAEASPEAFVYPIYLARPAY